MAKKTAISWTRHTFNGWWGCTKIDAPGDEPSECDNCLDTDTPVLMADLSWRPIGKLVRGDEVVAFTEAVAPGARRHFEKAVVEAAWSVTAEAVEIVVGGRRIVASRDHRFLATGRNEARGGAWPTASEVLGRPLADIGMPAWTPDLESEGFLSGYMAGAIAGDGTMRIAGSGKSGTLQSYMRVAVLASDRAILERLRAGLLVLGCTNVEIRPFDGGTGGLPMLKLETRRQDNLAIISGQALPERQDPSWRAGWLAGFFDTDGYYSGNNLRFSQKKPNDYLVRTQAYAAELGFEMVHEQGACPGVRLVGDLSDKIRFLGTIRPALARKGTDFYGREFAAARRSKVESVTDVGVRDLVDIQTSTGTFIAAGIGTHNCYAAAFAKRTGWSETGSHEPIWGDDVGRRFFGEKHWAEPLAWERAAIERGSPGTVFAFSMGDLFEFHPDPIVRARMGRDRGQLWDLVAATPHLVWLLLSKRPERMKAMVPPAWLEGGWPANVVPGTTAGTQRSANIRVPRLLSLPAPIRFLSCEPLLGPLDLRPWLADRAPEGERYSEPWAYECQAHGMPECRQDPSCSGVQWVIVGGESGSGPDRPRIDMDLAWARAVRDQCAVAGVPFHFKQVGGPRPTSGGHLLDGEELRAYPHLTWDPEYNPVSITTKEPTQ